MSSDIALPLVVAVVAYALFSTFNSLAGGRIDAALSSVIFNGLAALLSLGIFLWFRHSNTGSEVVARSSGVLYSVLAGLACGVFSVLLISIYAKGGELSYVFPAIYGGAIALTAIIGWLALGDSITLLHVVGVVAIAAGIGLLATK
jgi:uncharacterized membrane protein